uniref:Uncharacterized protein n=1 Tax=Sphaerodactylus townsendi TaxID=933632 RepID=A0ACB8EVC9_9SAUR
MYNGIGLPTPRGSGTNGYVQRNLSAVRHKKDRTDYKSEEELRKLESSLVKKPNQDILDHERKRKVELKCLELAELMEEQGYGEGEIQEKVATFRMMLLEKDVAVVKEGEQQQKPTGVTETHQLAEANEKKNERLRAAFGISDNYVDGSSFDPNRRAKEAASAAAAAKQQQEQKKQYSLVRESSSSRSPSPKQKKKKKKKDRGRSPSLKSKHKSKEKKRKRSTSESASQKDRRDRSSSPDGSSSSDGSHSSRSGSVSTQKRTTVRRQSKSPLTISQKRGETEEGSKNLPHRERSSSAEPARHGRSTSPRHSREKPEVKGSVVGQNCLMLTVVYQSSRRQETIEIELWV